MRRRWGWKTVPRGIGVGKADLFRFDLASSVWFGLVWFGLFRTSRSFRYSIVDKTRVVAMVRWYSMRVRDTRATQRPTVHPRTATHPRVTVGRCVVRDTRATQRPTVTRGCVAVRGWFHKERGEMYDLDRRDATRHVHASIRSSLSFSRSIHARFRVDYAHRVPAHVRTAFV